jgi:hypothetical protein
MDAIKGYKINFELLPIYDEKLPASPNGIGEDIK